MIFFYNLRNKNMFEKIIENLLKSILGEYIENLDPKKLSVSIWSGNIVL